MNMKYLNVVTEDKDGKYKLNDIINIVCDYAQNILSESDMRENDLKPLEIVTMISYKDKDTAVYRAAGIEMFFE